MKKTYLNLIDRIPTGPRAPRRVHCIVEIPKGTSNKYEYDPDLGAFRLDRVLYESIFFPTEYGVIPQTKNEADGDPLDVMVLSSFSTFPGCVLICRPIGILRLNDSGEQDNKIIAVPCHDPRFKDIQELDDLNSHTKKEIQNFWQNYSELQPNKKIKIEGWGGKKVARKAIKEAMIYYQKTSKNFKKLLTNE